MSTHGSSSLALVVALSLVLSHPGISAAGNLLEVPRTIEGTGAATVAMADLNGDGNLDLVAGYSVLLGNGDGTFQPKTDYPYLGTLLVDLNGDSKLDLAGLNSMGVAGGLSVMFGNGDGTFGAPVSYGTRSYPRFVAAGDLNRDGAQDLVVVNLGFENTPPNPSEPPSVSEIRSISWVFICNFLRGRSSSSSVKKQCVQRISQTDVTRILSKTGAKGCPIASFA